LKRARLLPAYIDSKEDFSEEEARDTLWRSKNVGKDHHCSRDCDAWILACRILFRLGFYPRNRGAAGLGFSFLDNECYF